MTGTRGTGETEVETHAQRVAAELHDGAMQEITLARLQLDLLAASMRDEPEFAAHLTQVGEVLGEASELLQGLMRALNAGTGVVHTSS